MEQPYWMSLKAGQDVLGEEWSVNCSWINDKVREKYGLLKGSLRGKKCEEGTLQTKRRVGTGKKRDTPEQSNSAEQRKKSLK